MLNRSTLACTLVCSSWIFASGPVQAAAWTQQGPGFANLWVVDANGRAGSQFTELAAAVASADDGDAILLRPGTYQGFELQNKSVSIFAEVGAQVQIIGDGLTYSDTPLNTPLVLSGLGEFGPAVRGPWAFQEVRGALMLQDCKVAATWGDLPITETEPAVQFEDVPNAFLDNCRLTGITGLDWGGANSVDPSPALEMTDGRLFIYHSQLNGGGGAEGTTLGNGTGEAGHGADGLVLHGGRTYLIGSQIKGGQGGNAANDPGDGCGNGGHGGPALHLADNDPWARLDSVVTLAGQGGQGKTGCQPGNPGQVLEYESGTFGILSPLAPPPTFEAPSVGREFAPLELEFRGEPGELVYWMSTALPIPTEVGGWGGLLLDSANGTVSQIGWLPPSGVIKTQITTSDVVLPGQCAFAFQQAAFLDPLNGVVRLSSARATLLVDSSQ